ncbi:hypothetical protein PHISCL_03611 [Aspergillus sclerotialis]|uniref:F-box domain-containing protein n=1 Tax=Aspergillus sclerotialis TaxID=2070753 RepID=A0A3A3A1Q5_9EURO|nr:hypothetical protein PHISCL_03611 [Aspergillus sclerotialis]
MSFDAIPNEIHCSLPLYIDNIETFINARATCRRLRDAFDRTHPNTILRLADASAPTFFSPHPHFLITATARQVSDWAIGDEERTAKLREAFRGGVDSLYGLCLRHSGLTLDKIHQTYLSRFSIINPFADKIDKMAGDQWMSTPDFWDGGVSEPYTIHTESTRAAFQILIYGELFGSSMWAVLEPEKNLPYFNIDTRLDYWTYCVPDWGCRSYPGYEVLPVGPYAEGEEGISAGDQFAMHYILECGRWRRIWSKALRDATGRHSEVADDVDDEHWRTKLYRNALITQGLEGAQLVTLPIEQISSEYLEKARGMVARISALEERPAMENLGNRGDTPVFHSPDPHDEVGVSIRDMWPTR